MNKGVVVGVVVAIIIAAILGAYAFVGIQEDSGPSGGMEMGDKAEVKVVTPTEGKEQQQESETAELGIRDEAEIGVEAPEEEEPGPQNYTIIVEEKLGVSAKP